MTVGQTLTTHSDVTMVTFSRLDKSGKTGQPIKINYTTPIRTFMMSLMMTLKKSWEKSVQGLTFHVRECTLVIEGQSREIKWLDKCFYVKSATKWLLSGPMILGEDVTSAIHAVQSVPREIPNWFHSQERGCHEISVLSNQQM